MALHLVLHSYSLRFHYLHKAGFDVFAFIERAVADGFTGVNINANGANYRHLSGMAADHVAAVRRRLDQHDLLRDLETSGTDPVHLQTLLAVAAALGARALRTYTRHKGSPRETMAATTRDLIAAAPLAEAAGVRILLENHEDFTGGECAEILAAVDSEWVGALYDYGNSMMVMEEPLAALAAMAPWIGAAHLKDHVMLAPEHAPDGRLSVLGVPIGEGNLAIVETTRRLVAAGLDRIAFENVWAYRAAVLDRRGRRDGDPPLGQGVYGFAAPPFDPACCELAPELLAQRDPGQLVELEAAALRRGIDWLRPHLAAAGITLAVR